MGPCCPALSRTRAGQLICALPSDRPCDICEANEVWGGAERVVTVHQDQTKGGGGELRTCRAEFCTLVKKAGL